MSCRVKPDFSTQQYWDEKYTEKETIFDWLEDYTELQPYITSHLTPHQRILIPGCGNSSLSENMYQNGFSHLVNIDFSPIVIDQMSRRSPALSWIVMDIKDMKFENNHFDAILDKGTIDALTCGGDVESNIFQALSEYTRVLKPGGMAFVISFGQSEDRLEYFNPSREHSWIYIGFDLLPREIAPHSHFHVYKIQKPTSL
jgi:ubiquinone/menaquinone biosynthesis C-methylase UbiE